MAQELQKVIPEACFPSRKCYCCFPKKENARQLTGRQVAGCAKEASTLGVGSSRLTAASSSGLSSAFPGAVRQTAHANS